MKIFRFCLKYFVPFLLLFSHVPSALPQEPLTKLIKQIEPSIVLITTYDDKRNSIGRGSGFFVNKRGDVITNRHVLFGAWRADVKTSTGEVFPIKNILAEDEKSDLILASIDIPNKFTHQLKISRRVPEVGERIIVIGSPMGLEKTVSEGIVSNVREIPDFGKIIQMTAPISQGSSGSPLIDLKGEVIGVVTFQLVEGQNLNFAIPGEKLVNLKPTEEQTFFQWTYYTCFGRVSGLSILGNESLKKENYSEALNYFQEAAKLYYRKAETFYKIGHCYNKLERYQEAILAYNQAIQIDNNLVDAYVELGTVYLHLLRYQDGIDLFKQAIIIKPDELSAYYWLGCAYLMVGNRTAALEQYRLLKDLNKELASILYDIIYKDEAKAAEANWVHQGNDNNGNKWFFDDQSTTRPSKNTVRVWVKAILSEKGVIDYVKRNGKQFEKLSHVIFLKEYNCVEKKVNRLVFTEYSSDGAVLGSYQSKTEDWSFIIPGSIEDVMFKAVCK
jgi:tetratricopeptide (TPR) repeat protein